MSEAQLDRIESTLTGLAVDVTGLKAGVGGLKGDVAELKADVSGLKGDVAELKGDVAELKTDVTGLKGDVVELKTGVNGLVGDVAELKNGQARLEVGHAQLSKQITDVHHEMHVLHEDLIDRIKATNETDLVRKDTQAAFARINSERANDKSTSEAVTRHFTESLRDHDVRINALEKRQK